MLVGEESVYHIVVIGGDVHTQKIHSKWDLKPEH